MRENLSGLVPRFPLMCDHCTGHMVAVAANLASCTACDRCTTWSS